MKTLQKHINEALNINEKLVINKNFKSTYDWDNVQYFFIVIFNSNGDFYIDIRKINDAYKDKFVKNNDNKYVFKCYCSLSAIFSSGSRDGIFIESKSGEFLWEMIKANDRSMSFYTLIIHPKIVENYDLNWLKYNMGYNVNYICNNLNINKNELPKNFFMFDEYRMLTRQDVIDKSKKLIDLFKV